MCWPQHATFDTTGEAVGEDVDRPDHAAAVALSGYRLRPEPVSATSYAFDLVADNILGGDDRILVDYKFTRDSRPRPPIVPGAILDLLTNLPPSDLHARSS